MMDKMFDKLKNRIDASEYSLDIGRIASAYEFAKRAHEGQTRRSGEAYISHPVEAAIILIDMGLDIDSIIASLLHDVIEDTGYSYADIKKEFGAGVADIVEGVTKLGKIPHTSKEEEQIENLRKMFLAMSEDIRVIIVKLADRLHNMRTLSSMPEPKQLITALETMEVYAPIAHRLGMQRVKIELEDLAVRYLDPIGCAEIEGNLTSKREEREAFLNGILDVMRKRLSDDNVTASVEGRVKQLYSIYRKVYGQGRDIDEIYDLYAIRIIVDDLSDCYYVLGFIHDIYKPIPGRFKDYISTPKANLYQSLHTTVIGKEGVPFEVQIRTWEMHRTAEYGIAAHWKYKTGIQNPKMLGDDLEWVSRFVEMQNEETDPEEWYQTFKVDFFSDEVFVFTPKGDVINLPAGSTVIDFAYAIHSAVGNRMIGAKVNSKMVQLDYQVSNGEIVEVLTTNAAKGPSRDWLNIVKTSEAKNKIRQWFKKERREENTVEGRAMIDRELKRAGIEILGDQREEVLLAAAKRIGLTGVDEMYASIGYGGTAITRIMPRIREEYARVVKPTVSDEEILQKMSEPQGGVQKKKQPSSSVVVEGIDNCLIRFAGCCNPLPGDDIIGYITKGYGVSVHRRDCPNAISGLEREQVRWVNVYWAAKDQASYQATVEIISNKKLGILADVSTLLAQLKIFIHAINVRETDEEEAIITITINVNDLEHLIMISKRLEKIDGIKSIRRGTN